MLSMLIMLDELKGTMSSYQSHLPTIARIAQPFDVRQLEFELCRRPAPIAFQCNKIQRLWIVIP